MLMLKRMLAGAALATSAAASAGVIDFENYEVGDTVFGDIISFPYNFVSTSGASGVIAFDAEAGIGKNLLLSNASGTPELFVGDFLIDEDSKFRPAIISFDLFAPTEGVRVYLQSERFGGVDRYAPIPVGQWTTFTALNPFTSSAKIKIKGGAVQFDNIVFEERIEALPEPSTWALMIGGFGAVGAVARRRKAIVALA